MRGDDRAGDRFLGFGVADHALDRPAWLGHDRAIGPVIVEVDEAGPVDGRPSLVHRPRDDLDAPKAIDGPLMSRVAIRSRPSPFRRNRPSASVVTGPTPPARPDQLFVDRDQYSASRRPPSVHRFQPSVERPRWSLGWTSR